MWILLKTSMLIRPLLRMYIFFFKKAHLQVGTSGKHTSTVHGFDCVAVEGRGRFGDDWRLGGGQDRGRRLGYQESPSLRAVAERLDGISCEAGDLGKGKKKVQSRENKDEKRRERAVKSGCGSTPSVSICQITQRQQNDG